MSVTMQKVGLQGLTVGVLGMQRTGQALAPALAAQGARPVLCDAKTRQALGDAATAIEALGAEVRYAAGTDAVLSEIDLLVPSPGVRRDAPVLLEALRRGIPVLSEIEIAYLIAPCDILAVTGTNGKTTVTLMLAAALRAAGRNAYAAGNISADNIKLPLVTAAAQAQPDDVIVAEISSFQLEWVDQFRPKVGILCNVSRDHMDRYSNMAEYAATKARIFARQREDDVAVVNVVNAPTRAVGRAVPGRALWFDKQHCGKPYHACVHDERLCVRWEGEEVALCRVDELRVKGNHNLENALAVAGSAVAYGADPRLVDLGLREFDGVVHRMELVGEAGGVTYINNSMCTNIDAAVRSMDSVRRPVVLIAGGSRKGETDFEPLGQAIARKARHLFVMGAMADEIANAARRAGFSRITYAGSMDEAVAGCAAVAAPGDVVLLSPACASFGLYSDFEHRGRAFREAARRAIAGRSTP
jgi:UDP-N-acetylmuramoylalanine--D-glutamate ligase